MPSRPARLLVVFAAAALLSACGGGGGGSTTPPNTRPAASFTAAPSSGTVPLTVQFDASASSDADGSIASYSWNFGDNTATGSGVTTSHVYQAAAVYTATLTVTDNRGATASTTRQVTAANVETPTLTLTASPPSVAAGQTATLTWASQAATSCTASGGWSGVRPASGTATTASITVTTTYTLTCTGPGGQVAQSVIVQVNAVAGRLLVSSISQSDGDVNDPFAPLRSNDTPETAQQVPNPVVVGGYVNEPGRGPDGRSFAAGDPDDIYRVSLAAGQVIELVIPSAEQGDDADLGLYDENLVLVDSSIGVGQVEQVTAPASGTYYVRVNLYSGAPLYRLSIGQASVTGAITSLRLSDEFVPGDVIVRMKDGAAAAATRQKSLATLDSAYGLRRKAGDASREMLMTVPGNAAQALQARKPVLAAAQAKGFTVPAELRRKLETLQYIKWLRALPDVAAADPNRIVHAVAVPNDEYYPMQRWHYEQIKLPAAWNVTTGSTNVVVAIVDTGVVAHPDLAANLIGGYDFVGNDTNPDDPGCAVGGGSVFHGTHVAGTVAAVSNNGNGVAGVAWNARLMPLRVLDGCSGSGSFYDVTQGIRYAAGLSNDSGGLPARRADVINLSLGGAASCDATTASLVAEVRAQGVVLVAAAGNENTSSRFMPASCPGVIAVSAVGPTGQKASYSNYGASWVDVAAPGGEMRSDVNGDGEPDGIFSTHATGGGDSRFATYELLQGTSMASPHVAGVVALMKTVKPAMTPAEVDTLLAQGLLTDDIGPAGADDLGIGLVNAFKAVQAVGTNLPPLPATLTVTPSSLNFGDIGTAAEVVATNGGSGALTVTGTTTSAPWLRVTESSVDASGLGRYSISVQRGDLAAGGYSGWVDFASSAGTTRVSVLMQVASTTTVPDAGYQYVLLIDPAGNDTIEQEEALARGASVPYRFGTVATGDYLVVSGTDMNNDGFICDDGEACGAYPVESVPLVVSVAGERLGLDFSTGFRTSLQSTSRGTAGGEGGEAGRSGFARKR